MSSGFLNEVIPLKPRIHPVKDVEVIHGPNRVGDIPHSLASIEKAQKLLGYNPEFSLQKGLKEAVSWYWEDLRK